MIRIGLDGCTRECEGSVSQTSIMDQWVCGHEDADLFEMPYTGKAVGTLYHGWSDEKPPNNECDDLLDLVPPYYEGDRLVGPDDLAQNQPKEPTPAPAPAIGLILKTPAPVGRTIPGNFQN